MASGAGTSYGGGSLDLSRFYLYGIPRAGGDLETIEARIEEEIGKLLDSGSRRKSFGGRRPA